MITIDEFKALEVGDVIEAVPLFEGLAPEPVTLKVEQVNGVLLVFAVTYFGIPMGRWSCTAQEDETLKWSLAA